MKLELSLQPVLNDKAKRVLRSKKSGLILEGPAGTGKTYLALARGIDQLIKQNVERLVIIRSPVEIREIGFLPGGADEKMEAYAGPYIDLLHEMLPKTKYKSLVQQGLVEFHPTTYLRGLTFHDAYIIVDEFQNLSEHELETVITRVGQNSQIVLTGDAAQSDLKATERGRYERVMDTLRAMTDDFDEIVFAAADIVRSGFVRRYYEQREQSQTGAGLANVLPLAASRRNQ